MRVELHFEGPLTNQGDLASLEVDRLLNRKAVTVPGLSLDALAASAPLAENVATAQKRTRRTKEQIAADEAAALEAQRVAHGTPGVDPAIVAAADADLRAAQTATLTFTEQVKEVNAEADAAKPAADVNFDFSSEPAKVEISDSQLNDACQAAATKLGGADGIKKLIGTFATDPTKQFSLREIPQAQRPDFLEKLTALS